MINVDFNSGERLESVSWAHIIKVIITYLITPGANQAPEGMFGGIRWRNNEFYAVCSWVYSSCIPIDSNSLETLFIFSLF